MRRVGRAHEDFVLAPSEEDGGKADVEPGERTENAGLEHEREAQGHERKTAGREPFESSVPTGGGVDAFDE